jgi:archaellum component FlaC
MNKLIKNFNDHLVKKQLKNADNKVNYLEESYDKIKKENQSMRNRNGLKEALRSEVEKCHQVIDTLKKEN